MRKVESKGPRRYRFSLFHRQKRVKVARTGNRAIGKRGEIRYIPEMDSNSAITIFDTHAHLDLEPLVDDFEAVLRRIEYGGFPDGFTPNGFENTTVILDGVLLPGIDAVSSRRCVEIAARSPKLHAGVAIQPNSVAQAAEGDWEIIAELACRDDVVAIGETGLDRYWDTVPFDIQRDFFFRHIALAKRRRLPILIHCREAEADLLPILQAESDPARPPADRLFGLLHAFSGGPDFALECVRLGFYISFAGSVTYRNKKFAPLWEAAQAVPADRLLLETDAPYMAPTPYRGKLERNEPLMTAYVANRLAELRGVSFEEIARITTRNAHQLFGKVVRD